MCLVFFAISHVFFRASRNAFISLRFLCFPGGGFGKKMLRGAKPSECYQKHVSCGNAGKRNVPHDNGFVSCDTGPKMCNNDNEQVPWGTCFCVIGCSG